MLLLSYFQTAEIEVRGECSSHHLIGGILLGCLTQRPQSFTQEELLLPEMLRSAAEIQLSP